MKKAGHRAMIVLVILLVWVVPARAAAPDMVLVAPRSPVRGGEAAVLDLYLHNPTDAPITSRLPLSLPCRIDTGRTIETVDAGLVEGRPHDRLTIPGQGFLKRSYRIDIPVYAAGVVHLQLESLPVNPLTIVVEKAPPEAWRGQQIPLNEGPTLLQTFLDNFSVYEPTYFLLGVDPGLDVSKFQFSFSYRLFNPDGYLGQKAPWLSIFHLGYTQRSFWDLKNDSKPFDDTSYMPELFFRLPKIDLNLDRVSAFGIQGGYQHESNGQDGEDSRSTNYLYVKPILGVRLAGPFHLKVAPKLFTYVDNDDDTNEDLKDYRGYVDLEIGVINPEGIALNTHLWWAEKGATVQADLTYPLTRLLGKSFNFYLQAQYFSGYAETLIRYDERRDAFRLGVSIVR